MTDTRCPAVMIDASASIIACTRDAGHGPDHWHEDGWGEIDWSWRAGESPRRVGR